MEEEDGRAMAGFSGGGSGEGGGTVGRGEKAGAFLYVRVGRARFQSMYSKKVKRSAFQKHHTALCNEARYHIGGLTRHLLRQHWGACNGVTKSNTDTCSLVHLTNLVSLHSICPLPFLSLLPLGPVNLHIQFSRVGV